VEAIHELFTLGRGLVRETILNEFPSPTGCLANLPIIGHLDLAPVSTFRAESGFGIVTIVFMQSPICPSGIARNKITIPFD
jgi:hypothetical protein